MSKDCFLSNAILEKNMEMDQKPRCSSCIVIQHHVSIIITIISNTTVLVSHNAFVLDVLCLWAMVSIKSLPQLSPLHPFPLPGFHQAFLLFYKQYFINIFLWSDCCNK